MKNILVLTCILLCIGVTNAQIITNTGANVIVGNNTNLIFHTLNNTGAGAYFYYDSQLNVPGDWINNSPADFAQGTNGRVILDGTTQQNVRCGGADFGKLYVDNSSGSDAAVVLVDDMLISDSLGLLNGIVSTSSNTLIFADGSKTMTGNSASFVDGKLQKTGATSFIFPSGDIKSQDFDGNGSVSYRVWAPFSMTPEIASDVNVEYFFDDDGMPDTWEHGGNMDASLHHVSSREFWLVNSDNNLSTVTLYWNDNAHANGDICIHGLDYGDPVDFEMSDLSVAFWSSTLWRDAGVASTTGGHDQGSISSDHTVPFGFKAPTYITLASKNNLNPLPVELVSFDADCYGKKVDLVWQTASEINNSGFYIERSIDAKTFKKIGFVHGSGNSNVPKSYVFSDNMPSRGNNYYRLRQVDNDGKETVSNIILAGCNDNDNENPEFVVYPNPSEDVVNAVAVNLPAENAIISVYNMLGSIITQEKVVVTAGSAFTVFDLSELPPAMYVVKIICGEYTGVKKVEIK